MRVPIAALALPVLALPVLALLPAAAIAATAADWQEIDRLTGDVPVELNRASVAKVMDGASEVMQATFRRRMPTGIMESDVAIDCKGASAKLRGLRLINGTNVYNQQVSPTLDYHPVSFGSADAIYYKALCGKEIAAPADYPADTATSAAAPAAPAADGAQ